GMCALLHTWGQNLSLHPHLHCIVPAGGLSPSGSWKASKSKGKFLFPVKEMSRVFRARFVAALRKKSSVSAPLCERLFAKPWVVYCKQPFFGPSQVVEYLGRYTHKIAISNHRIVSRTNGKVTFKAKDYRDKGKPMMLQLEEREFIRRFALHILPKGFTRIRHYGLMSSTSKAAAKETIDAQLGPVHMAERTSPILHRLCPVCKKGILQTIAVFDGRGPPAHWLSLL
ncbi:MAG: IS91 family transposase, partial [Gammaproteobacteria bacterium]|nr:IS91 family transposase [Gammaproteobacteria bacterium]